DARSAHLGPPISGGVVLRKDWRTPSAIAAHLQRAATSTGPIRSEGGSSIEFPRSSRIASSSIIMRLHRSYDRTNSRFFLGSSHRVARPRTRKLDRIRPRFTAPHVELTVRAGCILDGDVARRVRDTPIPQRTTRLVGDEDATSRFGDG